MADTTSTPEPSLLLLPAPLTPTDYGALKAGYGPPLTHVLRGLAAAGRSRGRVELLIVAFPHPSLRREVEGAAPAGQVFDQIQRTLAAFYKLVCVIAVQEKVADDGPGGVDVRARLLDGESHGSEVEPSRASPWTLAGLAGFRRGWERVIGLDSGPGRALLDRFLRLEELMTGRPRSDETVERLPCPDVWRPAEAVQATEASPADAGQHRHRSVAVGGTFDHLHAGHKLLLTMTLLLLEPGHGLQRMIVGITGDALLRNKKFAEYLEDWHSRQRAVTEFVDSLVCGPASAPAKADGSPAAGQAKAVKTRLRPDLELECVEIADAFGPTISDEAISALVVSAETRAGGQAVNQRRAELGWPPLQTFEVAVLFAREDEQAEAASDESSFASKISSTEIRRARSERTAGRPG